MFSIRKKLKRVQIKRKLVSYYSRKIPAKGFKFVNAPYLLQHCGISVAIRLTYLGYTGHDSEWPGVHLLLG